MSNNAPAVITLTQRSPADLAAAVDLTLPLTAEERGRSRHYFESAEGVPVYVSLPRGTMLEDGDLLRSEAETCLVRVLAKPEPVMTVRSTTPLGLLQAAYHLGNRHVSLELALDYLRLAPDAVLKSMLEQMGLCITEEIVAFHPESGAYGHHHAH